MKLKFSSPIGESTFSTPKRNELDEEQLVFVPYRGIYFLYSRDPLRNDDRRLEFSSPIGESTFSTNTEKFNPFTQECFRPLSGNLLSLRTQDVSEKIRRYEGFRPLSGNLLSLLLLHSERYSICSVFVPYRGIYFLYNTIIKP